MSLRLKLLNAWLKFKEKPALRRATDPLAVRAEFARQARLFFPMPRNMRSRAEDLDGPLGPSPVRWVYRDGDNPADPTRPLIFYIHGGAFVAGAPETHRGMVAVLCQMTGLSACLPRYTLSPEARFPQAVNEIIAAYRAVADHPAGVIIGGESAGGNLVLVLLAEILQQGHPKPLGCFALSPLTDMTFSADSITANAEQDVFLPTEQTHRIDEFYLKGADPLAPQASPLFAEFPECRAESFPVWIAVGSTEILFDDAKRMADKLRQAGADVQFTIADNHPHAWPLFYKFIPEARQTLAEIGDWIQQLPARSADS